MGALNTLIALYTHPLYVLKHVEPNMWNLAYDEFYMIWIPPLYQS